MHASASFDIHPCKTLVLVVGIVDTGNYPDAPDLTFQEDLVVDLDLVGRYLDSPCKLLVSCVAGKNIDKTDDHQDDGKIP